MDDLVQLLRQADEETLYQLVEHHVDRLDVPAVRQVLRNAFVSRRVIDLLLNQRRLMSSYEVRSAIAIHPRTPEIHARRLIPGLYWKDLTRVSSDVCVRPAVRRAADLKLADRIPGLAVGEKIAIARRGGPGVLGQLRNDPNPVVVSAVLDNPRLTEGLLMPVVARETTPGRVLSAIAANRRWGLRYNVKAAICRNPATPPATSLPLLPALKKNELQSICAGVRIPQVVRQRAGLLLGRGGPG